MVKHTCPNCKKVFNHKGPYDYHMNKKKNPCKKVIDEPNIEYNDGIEKYDNRQILEENKQVCNRIISVHQKSPISVQNCTKMVQFWCSFCTKSFTRKSSLIRHMKSRCKIKNTQDKEKELEEKLNVLQDQYNILADELKKQRTTNITNNINSNNNIQNITNHNNINIIGFGKEDLSFLSDKQIMYILDRGFNSVPELVERVHFNEEHPEFHNVYLTNISKDQSLVYKDDYWNRENAKDIVNRIIDEKKDFLDLKYQEYLEDNKIDPRIARKFERFQEKSHTDDYEMDSLYHKVKMILYNKRHIPIETMKRNKRNKKSC